MTVRVGIVGAGSIGRFHAAAAARAGGLVAGFCDADRGRAAALAEDHPGAVATSELDELLALPGLEAVVVAVPNHLHKPCAVRALEAGKDVLLEKPMAMSVAECDEIVDAMERAERFVQVGFVSRCSPTVLAVRAMIDAGRLGRVYRARGQWYRRRGIPGLGGWFTTKALSGGGVLIDLGVHLIDLMLHLTGRPRALRASGACTSTFGAPIEAYACTEMWAGPRRPEGTFDVDDGAAGLIRCEGGMTIELGTTWAVNLPEGALPTGIALMGERGGCFFDPWGGDIVLATEEDGRPVDVKPMLPPVDDRWGDAFRRQHERFLESVATRKPPDASARDGREVQSILDALYRSSAEAREVEI